MIRRRWDLPQIWCGDCVQFVVVVVAVSVSAVVVIVNCWRWRWRAQAQDWRRQQRRWLQLRRRLRQRACQFYLWDTRAAFAINGSSIYE